MVIKLPKHKKKVNKKDVWDKPTYVELKNTHHRLPRSRGGTNEASNLSCVPIRLHEAYNALFGSNPTVQEVASVLNSTWIDPHFKLVVVAVDSDDSDVDEQLYLSD